MKRNSLTEWIMLGQGHLNTQRCLNRQHSNNVCQERYSKRMVRTRDQKETYVGGNKTKTKEKQNIKKNKANLFWYCIEPYVYVVLLLSKTQNKKQNRKSKVNILIIYGDTMLNILTKKHLVITKTCRFHPASKEPMNSQTSKDIVLLHWHIHRLDCLRWF